MPWRPRSLGRVWTPTSPPAVKRGAPSPHWGSVRGGILHHTVTIRPLFLPWHQGGRVGALVRQSYPSLPLQHPGALKGSWNSTPLPSTKENLTPQGWWRPGGEPGCPPSPGSVRQDPTPWAVSNTQLKQTVSVRSRVSSHNTHHARGFNPCPYSPAPSVKWKRWGLNTSPA